jgi:hypothetical protein
MSNRNPTKHMFTKTDEKFATFAADTAKRQGMIASRQNYRTIFFWCAVVMTGLYLVAICSGAHGITGFSFGSLVQWMLVFKFDSDVRLLTVIDKISGQTPDGRNA